MTKRKTKPKKHDAAQANVKLSPPIRSTRPQPARRVRRKPDAVLIKASRRDGDNSAASYAVIAA